MGKYLSVCFGVGAIVIGGWGIMATWPLMVRAIQVLVPLCLVFGGLLAVLVGLAEIRDSFSRYRSRARSAASAHAEPPSPRPDGTPPMR